MLNLVERLRDIVPKKNTVLYLDEIIHLASNWIIINDFEPKETIDLGFAELNQPIIGDYEYIDSNQVEDEILGINSSDILLAEEIKKLELELNQYRKIQIQIWETTKHLKEPWNTPEQKDYNKNIYPKISSLETEIQSKKIHFQEYRPTLLTEKIRTSELILAPPRLLKKLEKEFPDQQFGIIENSANPNFKLYKSIDKKNRIRVVLKNSNKYEKEIDERIDTKTRELLFDKQQKETYSWLNMDDSKDRYTKKLPPEFSMHIPQNNQGRIKRSKTEIITRQETFRSILLGARDPESRHSSFFESTYHKNSLDYSEYDSRTEKANVFFKEPSNFYHLGGSYNNYQFSRNNTVTDLIKFKNNEAQKKYNSLWFEPMESIEEANDRLHLLEELVKNSEYNSRVRTIARHIGDIYEPFIHLNSLAEHITSNLLHSKWGAPIRQPDFYKDFMEIKNHFIEGYEKISESLESVTPSSREMNIAINSLSFVIHDELFMKKTYTFLKHVTEKNPTNFLELTSIFSNYLQETKAKKLESLEDYPEGDKHKSADFKKLMNTFQSQNPISSSNGVLNLISSISSKLIAYSSQAEFIKQKGWVKPELVSAEESIVDIRNGWYPLTKLQHTKDFVKNNTYLDLNKRIEIIDGPNVAGKTIDIKKTLMITMLAMSGNYVPAEYAKISFFNKLRFRLKNSGMNDHSALYAELKDLQPVMKSMGTPIIVGLDEIGTSTNDLEGEAIAYGITKRFANAKNSHLIISSHYPSLQDLLKDPTMKSVKFSHFRYGLQLNHNGRDITYDHKKIQGPNSQRDYALVIAENEKIPIKIIEYAENYLNIKDNTHYPDKWMFEKICDDLINQQLLENGYTENQIKNKDSYNLAIKEQNIDRLKILETIKKNMQEAIPQSISGVRSINEILESKTTEKLFGKDRSSESWSMIDEINYKISLKDVLKKPLTDINQIHERLDIIEELYNNKKGRAHFEKIMEFVKYDINELHESIQEYFSQTYLRYPEQQASKITTYNEVLNDLPTRIPIKQFKSERVKEIVREYNSFFNNPEFRSIKKELQTISTKIKNIEKEKIEKEMKKNKYNKNNTSVNEKELDSLITAELFTRAKNLYSTLPKSTQDLNIIMLLTNDAIKNKLTKPEVVPKEENCLKIKLGMYTKGKHTNSVPNTTNLSNGKRIELITGPNAAGKTYGIKTAMYIALKALCGAYVPAEHVKVSIRDHIILCEKGTGNVLSAFQQDSQNAIKTNPIPGQFWLIGLDETYTSTEKKGGEALTYGTIRNIIDQQNSLLLISSHYPTLSKNVKGIPEVKQVHYDFIKTTTDEGKVNIEFSHKKKLGPLQNYQYGIAVAESKKFDEGVINYAKERLNERIERFANGTT
ncbi:MAG: hypothetical protein WC758_00735 [Candidatus Woesearchaeota archaeon]|jgi:DNA mismatch repair ATPase MutS